MKDAASGLHQRIAERVRGLRGSQGLSLDALAVKSGVSRSMISLIERAESSPTAIVLDKLAVGLGVTLPALFDGISQAPETPATPVARRDDQVEWKDPGSGYIRRNVSPLGIAQPMQIAEIHFPPRRSVAFESAGRNVRVYQQVWMLEGAMEITIGNARHRLTQGDCLAMQVDQPTVFHNPTRKPARYAVVVATENATRR